MGLYEAIIQPLHPKQAQGHSIVYLSSCLWIKCITRIKIWGLCKDEANQKCAPWALLAQMSLWKAPQTRSQCGGHTNCHLAKHLRDSHWHALGWGRTVIRKGGFISPPSPPKGKDNLSLSGMWPFSWSIWGCSEIVLNGTRILTLCWLFPSKLPEVKR